MQLTNTTSLPSGEGLDALTKDQLRVMTICLFAFVGLFCIGVIVIVLGVRELLGKPEGFSRLWKKHAPATPLLPISENDVEARTVVYKFTKAVLKFVVYTWVVSRVFNFLRRNALPPTCTTPPSRLTSPQKDSPEAPVPDASSRSQTTRTQPPTPRPGGRANNTRLPQEQRTSTRPSPIPAPISTVPTTPANPTPATPAASAGSWGLPPSYEESEG
ncbi:hypothetical protein B0T20DRAFT_479531 [Sordaria brevicollis]|uniref:Uncharacterized protein n=1 Tax=Sordaria brevicollis TaxID=83679 RepID=A0AAE0UC86_SORBR|nr:hypothetical protein B0T20DRAFT_479531 [Sordaria brevicollis]